MDLVDIYSTFHPKVGEYTFFSTANGMFLKVNCWQPSSLVSEVVNPPTGEKAPWLGDLGTISH